MGKKVFIFLMILAISCHNHSNSTITKKLNYEDTLKPALIGKWGGGDNLPLWRIGMDSIYYYERSTSYRYKIYGHDLIIYLPDLTGALMNISVNKDTMFFWEYGEGEVKIFRIK